MTVVAWRDEKLYKLKAEDYGTALQRAFGVVVHSTAKGLGMAVIFALFFLTPRVPFRIWLGVLVPVAFICAVWVAVSDRRAYIGEIEVFEDRIVRHSGEKTIGIGRDEVISIKDGTHWTAFGLVDVLTIRSKKASIFIPAAINEYAEIKSKVGGWRSKVS